MVVPAVQLQDPSQAGPPHRHRRRPPHLPRAAACCSARSPCPTTGAKTSTGCGRSSADGWAYMTSGRQWVDFKRRLRSGRLDQDRRGHPRRQRLAPPPPRAVLHRRTDERLRPGGRVPGVPPLDSGSGGSTSSTASTTATSPRSSGPGSIRSRPTSPTRSGSTAPRSATSWPWPTPRSAAPKANATRSPSPTTPPATATRPT